MGLLDKVKGAAGKAAAGAKHATAVGKEKIEVARLQKKIADICEEIGRIVVGRSRGEADADADAQIDAKVAEIGELERQIEESNAGGDDAGTEA